MRLDTCRPDRAEDRDAMALSSDMLLLLRVSRGDRVEGCEIGGNEFDSGDGKKAGVAVGSGDGCGDGFGDLAMRASRP